MPCIAIVPTLWRRCLPSRIVWPRPTCRGSILTHPVVFGTTHLPLHPLQFSSASSSQKRCVNTTADARHLQDKIHQKPAPCQESDLILSDAQRRTIYALSTPPGKAGVAVVRASGPDALKVWQSMVRPSSGTKARTGRNAQLDPEPWKMYRCEIHHPSTGELLDSGLAVYFKGPRSFTAEDTVELHVHSGRAIITAILDALAVHPTCRIAEPGEFTRRAFLAGRLDLTEVEGLHDLIHAETASQRKAALQAVGGTLRTTFEALRADVLRALSLVEAVIDFGEEEVEEDVLDEAFVLAVRAQERVKRHLQDYRQGEILRSGVKLAIFGPPNAGKSSLLNFLAQREAAIVTNIPGTTRDVLELSLDIGGLPVVVADTAGLRRTDDEVEKIGVHRAANAIANSDIALCVLAVSDFLPDRAGDTASLPSPLIPDDVKAQIDPKKTLVLLNKTDLIHETSTVDAITLKEDIARSLGVSHVWSVSLTASTGVDTFLKEFGDKLKQRFDILLNVADPNAPLVLNSRHRAHLESAARFLNAFLAVQHVPRGAAYGPEGSSAVENMSGSGAELPGDLVSSAEDLRYAAQAIGKISGSIGVEDVLDVIFRDFCIGK